MAVREWSMRSMRCMLLALEKEGQGSRNAGDPPAAGKAKEIDFPLEPLERNTASTTPGFSSGKLVPDFSSREPLDNSFLVYNNKGF